MVFERAAPGNVFKEKTIVKTCIDCRQGDCDSCYEHDCPCNLCGHKKKPKKRPAR
jgi:hypothetical protein